MARRAVVTVAGACALATAVGGLLGALEPQRSVAAAPGAAERSPVAEPAGAQVARGSDVALASPAGRAARRPDAPAAAPARRKRVYVRVGAVGIGISRAAYEPATVSLGSTGYIADIAWSGWNGPVAVGRGTGHATSSSIPPRHRTGPATVRLSRRVACGRRRFYTVVSYRALGFASRETLGCRDGLHP